MAKKNKMTPSAAIRIQSATAKNNSGVVPENSFAAKAQSAAATNLNTGLVKAEG
jgi:hypothetical protein